jgi:general secretion pathway protein A
MPPGYEAFFGVFERPFSLTPDPRYHFQSRAHARAVGGLSTGIARQAPLLLLTGDLGTGKSTMCRTLQRVHQRRTQVVYVGQALLSAAELLERIGRELAGGKGPAAPALVEADRPPDDAALFAAVRARLLVRQAPPLLLLLDEAHRLPPTTVGPLLELSGLERDGVPLVQTVLAAQPPAFGSPTLPRQLDDAVGFRARLSPLDSNECEPYIQHRLRVAGGAPVPVAPRTVEVLHALSGGVPRLVNLLCERALHAAAAAGVRRLDPAHVESAALALELQRLRARRFRWYGSAAGAARPGR